MSPVTAAVVILGILLLAVGLGVLLQRRTARVRVVQGEELVDPRELGVAELGSAGTVVQFSTEYCARCPGTRRLLTELVRDRPEVAFVHVDVTNNPQLATKYRLLQTPTVLFVDAAGRARTRVSGVVTRPALNHELNTLTTPAGGTA